MRRRHRRRRPRRGGRFLPRDDRAHRAPRSRPHLRDPPRAVGTARPARLLGRSRPGDPSGYRGGSDEDQRIHLPEHTVHRRDPRVLRGEPARRGLPQIPRGGPGCAPGWRRGAVAPVRAEGARVSKPKRLGQILDLLAEKHEVSVQELVDTLGISPATARRDLDGLAEQQLLTRTRGGAMAHAIAFDLPVRYRDQRNAPQKAAIAHAVSAMIPHGSIIGLSGGTTTTAVAEALMGRPDVLESTGSPSLTVVTIGVNIATQLAMRRQIRTVIAGGVVTPRSYEAIGPYAEAVIKGVTLDYAIVGTDGIDEVHGATSQDDHEAQV